MDNKEKKNEQDMINTQVEPHNHRAIIGFDKNGVPKVLVPVSGHTHKHVDENGTEYEHSHEEVFTEDYMKAVAAYRKTFPTKQDVLDNVPDPAVKEMMLRMEQLGYDTAFDRFDKQQPQCSFGLSGTCCRICNMGPCRITPKSPRGVCGACNYFCNMFVQASGYEKTIPYQISTSITYAHKKELYDALDKMQGVNKYYIDTTDMSISLGKSTPIIKNNEIKDLENYTSAYSKLFSGEEDVSAVIHYVDDSEFNTLCENNGIDYNAFYGDSLKCVLLNNLTHKQDTTKVFTDNIIGKHIIQNSDYANDEKNPLDIEVGGLVKFDKNSLPCNLVAPSVVGIIMPYSQYVNVVNKGEKASNISMSVCIETDDHKNVAENLNNLLNEKDFGGTFVSDNVETLQTMNTVIFIVQVFVYGFISLISLITIANIINTISTNISLRRKEFAMLKSVGTAPSGFRKMVSLESVFYALKAVIFGVPISVLVCVVLNIMLGESKIPYQFDYKLYLAVIIVVFAIIALTMIYSVRKLKDDNIIETLKEDIS